MPRRTTLTSNLIAESLRKIKISAILFSVLLLSGCASLLNEAQKTSNSDSIKVKEESVSLISVVEAHHQNVSSRYSANALISPELLKQDLQQLVSRLIEIHPEPFEIINEIEFQAKVNKVALSLRYPISRSDFYLRVAPLITELHDVHSRINLPKHLQDEINFQIKQPSTSKIKLFPLAVLFETNGLYVAADLSAKASIPIGAKITSINGAPIEFLLSFMKRLTPNETETGLRRKIQVNFPWLLAVMGYASTSYKVGYEWSGKLFISVFQGNTPYREQSNTVESRSNDFQEDAAGSFSSDLTKENDAPVIGNPKSFYGFSQLSNKTALLWLNDFNEHPKFFSQFLNKHFTQFSNSGVTNLIVDLRYNDGGLSKNIRTFLSYLTTESIYWNRQGEIKISEPLRALHQLKTKQLRKSKYKWGLQWLPLEWTDYLQYEISWSELGEKVTVEFEPIEPSEVSVPQNIIVLTNGYCFSACSAFVAVVNKENLGETMGEVPGNYARVQYGYPIKTTLNHSLLELTIPTMKLVFDEAFRNRKESMSTVDNLITPDFKTTRTQQQIEDRVDSLLNKALNRLDGR